MAVGVWKGVYPQVFGRSKQLSLNKFFDPSTPSMKKGCDGENGKVKQKTGKKEKRLMIILATSSLPAVDRPNADRWNAARSCQNNLHSRGQLLVMGYNQNYIENESQWQFTNCESNFLIPMYTSRIIEYCRKCIDILIRLFSVGYLKAENYFISSVFLVK